MEPCRGQNERANGSLIIGDYKIIHKGGNADLRSLQKIHETFNTKYNKRR